MYEIWTGILDGFRFSTDIDREILYNDKNEEPQQADSVGAFRLQIVIVFFCTKG